MNIHPEQLGRIARMVGVPIVLHYLEELRDLVTKHLCSKVDCLAKAPWDHQQFVEDFQKRYNEHADNKLNIGEAHAAYRVIREMLSSCTKAEATAQLREMIN